MASWLSPKQSSGVRFSQPPQIRRIFVKMYMNMKKIILPIIVLSLLFGGVAFAQDDNLPDPGLTPDSPFYFLERIAERIGTFFTFGDIKKAGRHTALAAERLAEAKVMAEKEKPKLLEKTLERYENQLVKALLRTKKAETKGKDTKEITKTITEATQKHITVLERVLEKVPEQAKPAIERAITVSTKEGLEKAAESGQGFSIRALCIKEGGPPEQCEKFPQAVESFEALEAFCIEMGVSPEQCAETEAMCKEMGAITPDECSRGFFTIRSGVKTPLSEKEMEELRIQREADQAEAALRKKASGERIEELQRRGMEIPEEETVDN